MKNEKTKNALNLTYIALMAVIDMLLSALCGYSAIYLRLLDTAGSTTAFYEMLATNWLPGAVITAAIFALFGLYRVAWEYAGAQEYSWLALAAACSAGLYTVMVVSTQSSMPRSFPYIYWMLLFLATAAYRVILGKLPQRFTNRADSGAPKRRTMIIGAGSAGVMALREFEENRLSKNKVLCFIDDDKTKHGTRVRGVKVVGGTEKIGDAVRRMRIEEIVFCIPSAPHWERNRILKSCSETGVPVKALPTLSQLASGEVTLNLIKEVSIEDLLGRTQVTTDNAAIAQNVRGKTVLITGGGGSIGSELCRQIAAMEPERLIIFDIYENNAYDIQQELKRKFPQLRLTVLIGSVRDEARVRELFDSYHPQLVCHAAAHKHVPLMEDSPAESIKNNVFGTYNVAKAAGDFGAELFLLISTDKAVNPTNVMGASKRLCEMVVQSMNGRCSTSYIAVRFGNVLGSNGSVIPLFKKQIAAGGPVTVTDKRVTRFFMTIPEAVSLILQAAAYAEGGEVFVLDMGCPVRIDDMARQMIRLSGFEPDVDIKIEYTGLRPGEKLYEELLLKSEGLEKTDNNLIYVGHQKQYTPREIDGILDRLRAVMQCSNQQIRECMLSLIDEPADGMYIQLMLHSEAVS